MAAITLKFLVAPSSHTFEEISSPHYLITPSDRTGNRLAAVVENTSFKVWCIVKSTARSMGSSTLPFQTGPPEKRLSRFLGSGSGSARGRSSAGRATTTRSVTAPVPLRGWGPLWCMAPPGRWTRGLRALKVVTSVPVTP
jgi:hypothetical protein